MKKKIALIVSVALLAFACGCCKIENDTATRLTEGGNYEVADYIDPETGVHYLLLHWTYGSGICPRYNADGSLMVEDNKCVKGER